MRYPPYVSDDKCNNSVADDLFDGRAEEEKKYEDCEEDNVLVQLVEFLLPERELYLDACQSIRSDIDASVAAFAKFSANPDSDLFRLPLELLQLLCWLFDAPMHVLQARYTEVKVILQGDTRVAESLRHIHRAVQHRPTRTHGPPALLLSSIAVARLPITRDSSKMVIYTCRVCGKYFCPFHGDEVLMPDPIPVPAEHCLLPDAAIPCSNTCYNISVRAALDR